jgi:pimeloyl-ACP methyl ester carboxylesterase
MSRSTSGVAASRTATFVLVPGAWHGAWCYRRVADLLTARGHKVYALTLTGLADRSHLASDAVDLNTHVLDVVNLVNWESLEDVVLVGHSYAGLVITGAAEAIADKVGSIVYLDAFIPDDGQSMADITRRELPETGLLPPYSAKGMNVNAADQAWVDAKVTPHPARTYLQKLPVAQAYKTIAKKTYVRTAFSSALWQQLYESFQPMPDWTTYMIDCGHDLMIDKPEELADILEAVA